MSHPSQRTDPHDLPRPKSYGTIPPKPDDPQEIERLKRRISDNIREFKVKQAKSAADNTAAVAREKMINRGLGVVLAKVVMFSSSEDTRAAVRKVRAALRRAGLEVVVK